jgi:hypothetical protein
MLPLEVIGPSRRIRVGPGSLVIGLMNAEVIFGSVGIGGEGNETRSKFMLEPGSDAGLFFGRWVCYDRRGGVGK